MDLRDTPDEARFRAEVREWLAAAVTSLPSPPDRDDWPGRRAFDTAWQRRQFDAGYAGINWPAEYGGRGASPTEQLIFAEEAQRAGAPYVGHCFVSLLHAGPTIIAEGTDEQKARHLPAILRGEHVWCQGFSEPNAGSDLASLRTRAVRDGDHYVVTGQKIWTSYAQNSDFCELLVRTDPDAPKHRGISWLIMEMNSPGIEIRPLRTMEGTEEFCEVFLDEVRIPVANRVGSENDGWRVANVTFSFERGTAFVPDLLQSFDLIRALAQLARQVNRGAATAWDDAGVRRELGHLQAIADGLWALTRRNVSIAARGGTIGTAGSAFKVQFTEFRQKLAALSMRVLDRAALTMDDLDGWPVADLVYGQLFAIQTSIAAGTSQIQRNIIAERALGLPKER